MENAGMSWDRRQSVSGGTQTLPSLANITRAGVNKTPSVNGHSPPLNQQSADLRDSGNWSLSSARASNTSEPSFSPQLTLPPIEQHGLSNRSDSNNPSFSYNHSPTNSTFAASTTSLQNAAPGTTYAPGDALPAPSPSPSRRSSFDSRLGNLNLSSPINGTPATSQVSLASTLQRERGIQCNSPAPLRAENGSLTDGPSNSSVPNLNPLAFARRFAAGMSGEGSNGYNASNGKPNPPQRTAPPIIGAPRFPYMNGAHPNAPSPTKGFPYAFPDPEFAGPPSRDSRDGIQGRNSTTSLTGSLASSIFSTNSSMLHPGHINDSFTTNNQFAQPPNGNHHHSLQNHKTSAGVSGDSASPPATPYSRTPELRVSHKLAERKRRKEMKDLFDELRDQLPAERGGKSSKWEVLTKAIEFINQLKQSQENLVRTQEGMQRELDVLRNEAQTYMAMRNEIESLRLVQPQSQNYHQQSTNYHAQPHQGRMQGIERC